MVARLRQSRRASARHVESRLSKADVQMLIYTLEHDPSLSPDAEQILSLKRFLDEIQQQIARNRQREERRTYEEHNHHSA